MIPAAAFAFRGRAEAMSLADAHPSDFGRDPPARLGRSPYNRRRGFRLPWTGEGDEPRKGAFRTLAPTRTARAILRLGDKRRRRFSEHLVTPTLGGTTLVRTRLLRKTHGSLIDRE